MDEEGMEKEGHRIGVVLDHELVSCNADETFLFSYSFFLLYTCF
jgi:hypothetical protein